MSCAPKLNNVSDNFSASSYSNYVHINSVYIVKQKYWDPLSEKWENRWGKAHGVNRMATRINDTRQSHNIKSYKAD